MSESVSETEENGSEIKTIVIVPGIIIASVNGFSFSNGKIVNIDGQTASDALTMVSN